MSLCRWCAAFLALLVGRMQAADTRTPTEEGLVYDEANDLTMDYYAPKGPGVHPIAIIIHGGGYQRGNSKSGSEAYCADFLRSEEHTSELQSLRHLVCRLLLEKK